MRSQINKYRISLLSVLILIIAGGVFLFLNQGESGKAVSYNGHGGTFKNPLAEIDTPDPSMVYRAGFYYMTFTHNGTDIMVMRSRTMDFRQAERKVVWYPPADTGYSANIWAPEIQFIRGKWYIYFAADNGENENHRMYVLEGGSDDPLGAFTFKGQITDDSDKWAIDGLVMEHKEKLYFVWSGWEGDVNIAQNTYIAPMSDPLTISGPRVLLSEPQLEWEKAGGPPYINEGQSILYRDGRVFIVYSGAGSWTPFYSLGLLTLKSGSDPIDPGGWVKSEQPLLSMDEDAGVYGPGHNSFVSSPDGEQQWIIYHATTGAADGWNNRKARAGLISWTKEGLPVFGKPLGLNTPIEVPGGIGVFHKENAVETDSHLTFSDLPSTVATSVPLLVHYYNQGEYTESIEVLLNRKDKFTIDLVPTGSERLGYAYVSLPFAAGRNELSFKQKLEKVAVSAIEIPRFEAESAFLEGDSEWEENPYASEGALASLYYNEKTGVRFTNIRVPRSGMYNITLAVMNADQTGARLSISANRGITVIHAIEPQERNQSALVQVKLELKEGTNEISVFASQGSFSIDYMDVWQDYK